jgi:DMSO/TMAO reductase YedYZ molybdopterin-dependent catalytic subunit
VPPIKLSRRELLLAGTALLAGCDPSSPQEGFLGRMDRFTNRAESALFRSGKLAPTADLSSLTPLSAFPQYKIGDEFPQLPAGWALDVGGVVARPMRLSLADL